MYKIGTLNKNSPVGLARLDRRLHSHRRRRRSKRYYSQKLRHARDGAFDNLLAVGRAGAGVNNIPLDKCAEQGIVVFNARVLTPTQ